MCGVYNTRTVYHLFREELYKARNFTIKHRLNDSQFELVHAMFDEDPTATQFKVTLHDAESIHCSCGLHEHKGMLCRHALKVLMILDKKEIPKNNIMERWLKDSLLSSMASKAAQIMPPNMETPDKIKKNMLLKKILELVSSEEIADETFQIAMDALNRSASRNRAPKRKDHPYEDTIDFNNQEIPTSFPARPIGGGRPPNTGIKSYLKGLSKDGKRQKKMSDTNPDTMTDEENPKGWKTKKLIEVM